MFLSLNSRLENDQSSIKENSDQLAVPPADPDQVRLERIASAMRDEGTVGWSMEKDSVAKPASLKHVQSQIEFES